MGMKSSIVRHFYVRWRDIFWSEVISARCRSHNEKHKSYVHFLTIVWPYFQEHRALTHAAVAYNFCRHVLQPPLLAPSLSRPRAYLSLVYSTGYMIFNKYTWDLCFSLCSVYHMEIPSFTCQLQSSNRWRRNSSFFFTKKEIFRIVQFYPQTSANISKISWLDRMGQIAWSSLSQTRANTIMRFKIRPFKLLQESMVRSLPRGYSRDNSHSCFAFA